MSAGCSRAPITKFKHKATMNESKKTVTDLSQPVNFTEKELQRFWSRVNKTDGCWLWTWGKDEDGYGIVRLTYRMFRCHRLSWMLHNGPIPKETPCVLHNCPGVDNPSCINPSHLWLGTAADNNADRDAKGRGRGGNSKLAGDVVREIRKLRSNGTLVRIIAEKFGVSIWTVEGIVYGQCYNYFA